MNQFNWTKALGYAALIWAIMFVLGAVVVGVGIGLTLWTVLALGVIAALVAYGFALNAAPQTAAQAMGYGLTFVVMGLLLDFLITMRIQNQIFGMWTYWLGYMLVLLAPFTAIERHQTVGHSHV